MEKKKKKNYSEAEQVVSPRCGANSARGKSGVHIYVAAHRMRDTELALFYVNDRQATKTFRNIFLEDEISHKLMNYIDYGTQFSR